MEETLGKRIAAHRRRLGLTQDRLAELLGVTAQAVSKWENDQSCPDITTLPKLSNIFGCTIDALLGMEARPVSEGELVPAPEEDPSPEEARPRAVLREESIIKNPGRKTSVLMALWVLLTGGLLFLPHGDFWGLLWRVGLLVFGLGGLWPRFSFFRLVCALFGGYLLMNHLMLFPEIFNRDMGWMLPAFLILFGLHLLWNAFRGPGEDPPGHILHPSVTRENRCDVEGEAFACATCFGENHYLIEVPRLSRGRAAVSFGELTVDLRGCQTIAEGCAVDLKASFGSLELLIPRTCQAVTDPSTAFGSVEIIGTPAPDAGDSIFLKCGASFGQITLRYV